MNQRTRILVVDDNPSVLQTFSAILRIEGYEVYEASTGEQAVEATQKRLPDVVLTDVMLPGLNGYELCRKIKSDPAMVDVFVVLVSGGAISPGHEIDGFEIGADDYIVKPVDRQVFLARIRTIVRLRNTTAALRASEQRHRRLVDILPEGVALIGLDGQLLAVNSQGAKMVGYDDAEQLLERTVFDLTLAKDHERLRADITRTLESGILRNTEYSVLRKSGEYFPAEISAAAATNGNGPPSGIVLVVRDTTDRKQAEEALQEQARFLANSARFLQTLMDAIPAPVFYKDTNGRYLGCNRVFEQNLGLSQDKIIGKTVVDLAPGDLAAIYDQADRELLQRPGTQTYESSVVYADGKRHQVLFNKATFQNSTGEVAGLVGVILDITDRKQAEERIRLLADAVQSTQELICITDRDNRFTFVNRAFVDAYGYSVEELLGRTPDILYSPRNPPSLCEHVFQQTLQGGWTGEMFDRRKDGTEFPIALTTSQIKNSSGETIGLVGVARDISERIRAERRNFAFSELGYRLSAANTREQAAEIILDIANELFGWDAGFVHLGALTDDKIVRLRTVDTVNNERVVIPRPTAPPTPLMRLVMEQGPRLIDQKSEPSLPVTPVPFGNTERRAASRMYVPIHASGTVIGILSIQSYTPQAYADEDLLLLQTLADYCGDALERIKVTESLREAEAKYRSIVENATEGIFQTTPHGNFRSANPALARILGYETPEELITAVADLQRQHYVRPEKRDELKRRMETHNAVSDFEFESYRKDGSRIWVRMNARAVRDANGKMEYYEGTIQDITKRKSAEKALEISQTLQESLLNNIPDPAWLKDAEGRFLACNERFAKFLRQERSRIAGRSLLDLNQPDAARRMAEDKEVMQSRQQGRFEWRQIDAQGRVGWFESIKSPLFGEGGKVTGTVGIYRDITEQKWVENLLRLQRDFAIFLNSSDDLAIAAQQLLKVCLENEGLDCGAVYLVNAETETLELVAYQGLSDSFAKRIAQFETAPGRHRKPGTIAAIHRPDAAAPLAGIMQHLKGEGLLTLEAVPLEDSGRVVALLNVGSHVQAEISIKTRHAIEALGAQAGGAIARIRAEQSLRTSQQVLEKTINSIHAAVFITDAKTTSIQDCNPAAPRLFGYGRAEMIGQTTARLLLSKGTKNEFVRHQQATGKEEESLAGFECQMKRKDGTSFPAEYSLAPIRNEAGQIVSWVSVIHDITERKRIEEDLRQLSRRIIEAQEVERQRVARELHDGVNQLIASARMRLRKVQDGIPLYPAARELLLRCEEVLIQALDENRRIAQDLRPADLDALGLVEACRNLCKQLQLRTRLQVKCRLARFAERCPPPVELNLFRIVQEALNNVEKYAQAKTVVVRITRQKNGLTLTVHDDGRGFDPANLKTPKRRGEGTGFTNMRERAAILGGTCQVASSPAQGTTIIVHIPEAFRQ